jgi:hypothetical protein
VLQQTDTQYDKDGNLILVTTRQRFHNETATGALGNATTAPKARVSYVAYYYDAANRPTATVDVGTNGGSAYTRPANPPSSSPTVLVTTEAYNSAGWMRQLPVHGRANYAGAGRNPARRVGALLLDESSKRLAVRPVNPRVLSATSSLDGLRTGDKSHSESSPARNITISW